MKLKILSIDYGSKRTGLAVSDPLQFIASSLTTIKTKNLMHFLNIYLYEENIQKVVVGEQKNLKSLPSVIEKEIQYFIRKFCLYFPDILIERFDERFTSKLANLTLFGIKNKIKTNKIILDKISATLILQSYLIQNKKKKSMILPIKNYRDPILRTKCKKIDVFDYTLYHFINDMFDTMHHNYGIGLAAPQIGKNLRIFVLDTSTFIIDKSEIIFKRVFINPEIIKRYGKTWKLKEGCLSIPDIIAKIERYDSIHLKYYNEDMEKCEDIFHGLSSRVIQHEYDHIEGKLFIDFFRKKW